MIYTYSDADKLSYTPKALRFVYSSTMTQVTAFRLQCIVEEMPCFFP